MPSTCRTQGEEGGLSAEDRDPGEILALEVLQRRATAGRDVTELVVGEAELPHGGRRVTATDDSQRAGARGVDEAWATAFVPAANGAISKAPIGPFQKTVRASASFAA